MFGVSVELGFGMIQSSETNQPIKGVTHYNTMHLHNLENQADTYPELRRLKA